MTAQWKRNKALAEGVMYGDGEKARKALAKGADPNEPVRAKNRHSTLLLQALTLAPELVRSLIEAGADVNATDFQGASPLHMAEKPEQIAMLLDAKASPLARTARGETPLHTVLCKEAAQLLVDAGADLHAKCLRGRLPWEAVERAIPDVRARGPSAAELLADLEETVGWLRAQAEQEDFEANTAQSKMTPENQNARAGRGRI